MEKKYKSPALQALHSIMKTCYEHGGINKQQMSRFDASCLAEPSDTKKPHHKVLTIRLSAQAQSDLHQLVILTGKTETQIIQDAVHAAAYVSCPSSHSTTVGV